MLKNKIKNILAKPLKSTERDWNCNFEKPSIKKTRRPQPQLWILAWKVFNTHNFFHSFWREPTIEINQFSKCRWWTTPAFLIKEIFCELNMPHFQWSVTWNYVFSLSKFKIENSNKYYNSRSYSESQIYEYIARVF